MAGAQGGQHRVAIGRANLRFGVLDVYKRQGYEDRERYRIMRKVGLSRREIRRSIS